MIKKCLFIFLLIGLASRSQLAQDIKLAQSTAQYKKVYIGEVTIG